MKNKILLLFFFFSVFVPAQTEIERWAEKKDPYFKDITGESHSGGQESAITSIIVSPVISLYRFLISDQDGDNCPFYPSCSEFFIQSVDKTNLFSGILMFGDRFTRDMNIFNRRSKYPFIKNTRLYDPPDLYTLDQISYPPK